MAVPNSGELSLVRIFGELNEDDYTTFNPDGESPSLKNCSTGANPPDKDINEANISGSFQGFPDGSVPHAMSEFYGYDHDFNPFGSVIANFTLTATAAGGGLGSAAFSGNKTFTISADDSSITGSIEVPGTNNGVLSLSMSDQGDPGAGGTGNSATGYVEQGTACELELTSAANPKTINCRFKFVPHTSAANQTVDVTFSLGISGAPTDVVEILKASARSDRRLKTNIEMIGYSPSNIPIYIFNYKNDLNTKYKGTMAQDLIEMGLSDSVIMEDDGYYSVYYNKIDVDMGIVI